MDIIPNTQAFHLREIGRTELAGPLRGLADLRMLVRQPPADFEQDSAEGLAHFARQGRGGGPAFHPLLPERIDAFDLGRR